MAYLGLSPEPDQYFTSPGFTVPGEALSCGDYCATKKAGIVPMGYLVRPEGCTCPDEVASPGTIQLTPQQIEAQVKQIQPAQGGGLALAAIAALLILGA